ncbi:hypothetical protein GTY88_05390, partial [Streptomyces sp. SID5926]|nr:hypothetical protein [Streptomyces sp. SID5926]
GVATGPGRALVKLLVVGALLVGGNLVASRALAGGMQEGRRSPRSSTSCGASSTTTWRRRSPVPGCRSPWSPSSGCARTSRRWAPAPRTS